MRYDVAIIGGGITGLAAAYRLSRDAPHLSMVLSEREARLGGKILTDRVDGFVIEGGPDSILASKPRGIELAEELGIADGLEGTNNTMRRTYIRYGGVLHDLPEGLTGLVPSRLEPLLNSSLLTESGKRRVAQEPDIPSRSSGEDESVAAFITRRFGTEVYDRMIEPMVAGIYGGDGRELSLLATFPQLRRMELESGSLIGAAERRQVQQPRPENARSPFVTPRNGMAEFVERLQQLLAHTAMGRTTGTAEVYRANEGFTLLTEDGQTFEASSVILATPAHVAARLVGTLDPALASALGEIPHVSSATVSLGYRNQDIPRVLDGRGYLIPAIEEGPILACTWTSSKFRHRAPEGYRLVRLFFGGAVRLDLVQQSDDELVEMARAELREVLGATAPPVLTRVYRWPFGMPQYTIGHLDRLRRIDSRLQDVPGLQIAGNAYHGVGVPDCIASGEAASQRAAAYLRLSA